MACTMSWAARHRAYHSLVASARWAGVVAGEALSAPWMHGPHGVCVGHFMGGTCTYVYVRVVFWGEVPCVLGDVRTAKI